MWDRKGMAVCPARNLEAEGTAMDRVHEAPKNLKVSCRDQVKAGRGAMTQDVHVRSSIFDPVSVESLMSQFRCRTLSFFNSARCATRPMLRSLSVPKTATVNSATASRTAQRVEIRLRVTGIKITAITVIITPPRSMLHSMCGIMRSRLRFPRLGLVTGDNPRPRHAEFRFRLRVGIGGIHLLEDGPDNRGGEPSVI